MSLEELKIHLVGYDDELYSAFKEHCGNLSNVFVHKGNILQLEVDAVVSPANSYGFMDGGIDLFYTLRFGPGLQKNLQNLIKVLPYEGELLVGQAIGLRTNDPKIPFMISAPTMRVPLILDKDTINPYLATKAALMVCKNFYPTEIVSIAFPGMGTGVGKVNPHTCAKQMKQAILDVRQPSVFPVSWLEAAQKHNLMLNSSQQPKI